MNRKLTYSITLLSMCAIHAADHDTSNMSEETVARMTQHLETLQTMCAQLEAIETDLDRYQIEQAPTRFDLVSTMSHGRETADVMLAATQGFLSHAKEHLTTFIGYLVTLPFSFTGNKPHQNCCPHHHS